MTQAKLLNDSDYIYEEVEIEQVQQLLNDGYDVEVDSPEGYTKVLRYVEKGTKWMFDIKCNNKDIHASYDHLFETQEGWVLTHELDPSKHNILCDDGRFHSFTIKDTGNMNEVVDIEVSNPKHRYYTNGLSSHNTNIGKTLMLCSMAASMLLAGKKVLYLSFEDPELKIYQRIAQNLMDLTQSQLKTMTRDTFLQRFEQVKQRCIGGRLKIKHQPEFTTNALMINSMLKEYKEREHFEPDVIFIDYIGCMIPNGYSKDMNDNTRLTQVAMQVRAIATTYHLPIVSAAQVNRGGYGSADVGLDDAADSFGQMTKADAVFIITRPPEMEKAGMYKIFLGKTRYGITGPTMTTIGVDTEKQRIYDLTQQQVTLFEEETSDTYMAKPDDGPDINDFI